MRPAGGKVWEWAKAFFSPLQHVSSKFSFLFLWSRITQAWHYLPCKNLVVYKCFSPRVPPPYIDRKVAQTLIEMLEGFRFFALGDAYWLLGTVCGRVSRTYCFITLPPSSSVGHSEMVCLWKWLFCLKEWLIASKREIIYNFSVEFVLSHGHLHPNRDCGRN